MAPVKGTRDAPVIRAGATGTRWRTNPGGAWHARRGSILEELAHFLNDPRFIFYEHVVAGLRKLDDFRALHTIAEVLECTPHPCRDRFDRALVFLLAGAVQVHVIGVTVFRGHGEEKAESRGLDAVVLGRLQ